MIRWPTGSLRGDLIDGRGVNADGVVNAVDLIELLGNWGPCP